MSSILTYDNLQFNNTATSDMSNKAAVYEEAFKSRFWDLWKNTPLKSDASLMAFVHANLIFINENLHNEHDKRWLLYQYMKGYLSTNESDDLLNKIFALLPSSNHIVKKVLDNLCLTYNNAPSRKFAIENESIKEELTKMIEDSNLNQILSEAERTAYLTGEIIIRPIFDDNKGLSYEIHTRDNYGYAINANNEKELYIHTQTSDGNGGTLDVFFIWTDTTVKVVDAKGEAITKRLLGYIDDKNISGYVYNDNETIVNHSYGKIPYLRLFLNDSNINRTNTQYEIIRSQLEDNRLETATINNTVFNGFSMLIGVNTNFKDANIKFGAGNYIEFNDVNDFAVEPSISEFAPSQQYLELTELRNINTRNILRRYNLPNWAIDESANLQSGVAMELSRIPLIESQKKNNLQLKQFDKSLIYEVCKAYNLQFEDKYPIDFDISIDYIETQYPANEAENYEINKQKLSDGVIGAKYFLQSVTDIDDIANDDAAIEFIEQNKQKLINVLPKEEEVIDTNNNDASIT